MISVTFTVGVRPGNKTRPGTSPAPPPGSTAPAAARFTGARWKARRFAGGLHFGQHRHFRGGYGLEWLAALPLPAGQDRPDGQPVALLDHTRRDIERHLDRQGLREACAYRPPAQVYQDIGHGSQQDWHALTARHLTRLPGSGLPVTYSLSAARPGDETSGPHRDARHGAIVQARGARTGQTGEHLLAATDEPGWELTTQAGDILLPPTYMPHTVTTPQQPGHSLHLAFALNRDAPAEVPG